MKTGLYARLAWTGMVKNKRLYLPYGLSAAGMVLMFYILTGLSGSPVLEHMSGGRSSTIILRLGTVVIAVFALIFLFYTHSFLIRRREREFGLYNVLGMGKGSIARILLWETAITYGLTTGTGLLLGVVLYKLAELGLGLTLSISLHAPTNQIRSSMMPVNDAYPVEQLIQTVRRYQDTTGRRVSFEYSMVRGVNDSDACAKQLANLIRGMGAHVNLIPINPVDGSPYSATDAANVRRFQQKLESLGVNATVRRRLGSEISAACGQLRRDEMNGKA